jgi:hypothetical protein
MERNQKKPEETQCNQPQTKQKKRMTKQGKQNKKIKQENKEDIKAKPIENLLGLFLGRLNRRGKEHEKGNQARCTDNKTDWQQSNWERSEEGEGEIEMKGRSKKRGGAQMQRSTDSKPRHQMQLLFRHKQVASK